MDICVELADCLNGGRQCNTVAVSWIALVQRLDGALSWPAAC